MRKIPTSFFVGALAGMLSMSCFAGQFRVACYGDVYDCAPKVADIVTDKFIKSFPASKFTIVAIVDFQRYSAGGGVGYAVAGVSQNAKGEPTQVPLKRFSPTIRVTDGNVSPSQVTRELDELLRRAVEEMMAECERSPNCDIYRRNN